MGRSAVFVILMAIAIIFIMPRLGYVAFRGFLSALGCRLEPAEASSMRWACDEHEIGTGVDVEADMQKSMKLKTGVGMGRDTDMEKSMQVQMGTGMGRWSSSSV